MKGGSCEALTERDTVTPTAATVCMHSQLQPVAWWSSRHAEKPCRPWSAHGAPDVTCFDVGGMKNSNPFARKPFFARIY